jgi:hypothetical protein
MEGNEKLLAVTIRVTNAGSGPAVLTFLDLQPYISDNLPLWEGDHWKNFTMITLLPLTWCSHSPLGRCT